MRGSQDDTPPYQEGPTEGGQQRNSPGHLPRTIQPEEVADFYILFKLRKPLCLPRKSEPGGQRRGESWEIPQH